MGSPDAELPPESLSKQTDFVLEIDRLKSVLRRTPLLDRSRRENSAEHSWQIALMAVLLSEHADPAVDVNHVVVMLLVHDLVEIDAGDTFIYDEEAPPPRPLASYRPPSASSACYLTIRASASGLFGMSSRPTRLRRRALQTPSTDCSHC